MARIMHTLSKKQFPLSYGEGKEHLKAVYIFFIYKKYNVFTQAALLCKSYFGNSYSNYTEGKGIYRLVEFALKSK